MYGIICTEDQALWYERMCGIYMKNRWIPLLSAMLMLLLLCACGRTAEPAETDTPGTDIPADTDGTEQQETDTGTDILVVYFSATGHTKPVAEYAADLLSADLYEIVPEQPYTEADLDYYSGGRCDQEQNDPNVRPEIHGEIPDIGRYSTILIGHPIWHGQAPRIISTFLESGNFSGKTLVTFCTSGSSGVGSSARNLQVLVPDNVTWLESRRFAIGASKEEVESWLKDIGLEIVSESEQGSQQPSDEGKKMVMRINGTEVPVTWEDNDSVSELEVLAESGLKISMSLYGGFEQVGSIGKDITADDRQIVTSPGDIVLYSGDQLVIFYGSNSWSYTMLGKIDLRADEIMEMLSYSGATVTLDME